MKGMLQIRSLPFMINIFLKAFPFLESLSLKHLFLELLSEDDVAESL